ncbi:hypothetical protein PO587_33085 [Streptomyces gilvifuscus]|uniref:Uncharacterized protein n=1 Tax=Streptomyces gilvifuscus TaxID=1550617 RepID=A0ABT5G394_9ACTN|nr:hypothetical protein [Streptomyces gilvifuscus]MDC2959279.1 hypothetical protein [Streptomyces gilvifuscus]
MKTLAACSPAPGRLDVFLGADDGAVWHKVFDGTWGPWQSLGRPRPALGAPDADWLTTTSGGPGRIDLLAVDGGHELWHRACLDGGWTPWARHGLLTPYSATGGFTAAAGHDRGDLHVFHHAGGPGAEIVHQRPDGSEDALRPGPRARGGLAAVPAGPGRFDLFAADALEPGYLRGRCEAGWPTAWDALGRPPDDGQPTPSFAATTRDFFAVGGPGLWHRALDGPPVWEDLGGDLVTGDGQGPAPLAAVSWGPGRTDVFALWAGIGVMHRWHEGEWSDWEVLDVRDASPGIYHVLRPQDLVVLTVGSVGLTERQRPDGVVELVASRTGGRLIVDFPPQHTTEAVLNSGTSAQARIAGPTRLHFAVGLDPIPLTVDGLLDAMGRLPLVTTPQSPGQEVCRLELPWRLLLALRPGRDCPHCEHLSEPAATTDGATELWHSRITGPGPHQLLEVTPYQALPDDSGFSTPLGAVADTIALLGRGHPDQPVAVERLMLSAFGAWFAASVDWPELGWTHSAAMGRDVRVRVLKRGALFPFGHRASYVEVTRRQFESGGSAVAPLRKQRTLIVTEPVRDYGIGAGGPHERRFPFQRVTIAPLQVTDLDAPVELGNGVFWPMRSGEVVVFDVRGQAGPEVVDLRLPLLFADDAAIGAGNAAALDALYAQGHATLARSGSARPTSDVGRRMPLAMQSPTQVMPGAEQEVQSMAFGAVAIAPAANGVGFHPQVTGMEVGLPAVRQLLGPTPPVPAVFTDALVQTPLGGTPPDALLDLLEHKLLNFSAAGPRTGLLAAPNMTVTQISRSLGPVVGGPLPSPKDLFGPDATLFGVVPLQSIMSVIDEKPTVLWTQTGSTPSATLTWNQSLTRGFPPFYPAATSKVSLKVVTDVVGDGVDHRPVTHTTGVINDFQLKIPTSRDPLVTLSFSNVTFTGDSGGNVGLSYGLTGAELGGDLDFVQKLAQFMPHTAGTGPRVETSATQIRATYTVAVPTTGLLVFTVQNLVLEMGLTLSLTNRPIEIDFAFGTRERPFLVTVSGFGGGGYLELGIGAGGADSGLQRLVGGIEFGASVAMDFGIASAEVHVLGGVVLVKNGSDVQITGYLRIGGSVCVLGLIRVSVELTMSLTYDSGTSTLSGSARLVISVDLTFWSTSVTLECHKTFKAPDLLATGADALRAAADGSVEAALGPQQTSYPWQTYCRAFAGE